MVNGLAVIPVRGQPIQKPNQALLREAWVNFPAFFSNVPNLVSLD